MLNGVAPTQPTQLSPLFAARIRLRMGCEEYERYVNKGDARQRLWINFRVYVCVCGISSGRKLSYGKRWRQRLHLSIRQLDKKLAVLLYEAMHAPAKEITE
jgi:hypothetical protein